ncbi:MAG: hypothetical protein ACRETD_13530 [Steroidobacteraceae bacterium]
MGKIFNFWWMCVKRAAHGSSAFANDWQWLFGIPACSGLAIWLAARFHVTDLSTGSPILDGALGASSAFVVTWFVALVARLLGEPAKLYHERKDSVSRLTTEIETLQRRKIEAQEAHTAAILEQSTILGLRPN